MSGGISRLYYYALGQIRILVHNYIFLNHMQIVDYNTDLIPIFILTQ